MKDVRSLNSINIPGYPFRPRSPLRPGKPAPPSRPGIPWSPLVPGIPGKMKITFSLGWKDYFISNNLPFMPGGPFKPNQTQCVIFIIYD